MTVGTRRLVTINQLGEFLQANPPVDGNDLPRALAFEIAHKVGLRHCSHAEEPQPLGDIGLAACKKAAEHPGLCDVYHAHIIAAVRTSDVIEKWGENNLTANKYFPILKPPRGRKTK